MGSNSSVRIRTRGTTAATTEAPVVPEMTTTVATLLPDVYVLGGVHHTHAEFKAPSLWKPHNDNNESSKFERLHQQLDGFLHDMISAAFPDATQPEIPKPSPHAQALLEAEFEKGVSAVHQALETFEPFYSEMATPLSEERGHLIRHLYAFVFATFQSIETLARTALKPNPLPLAYFKGFAEVNLSYLAIYLGAFDHLTQRLQSGDESDNILLAQGRLLKGDLLVAPDTVLNLATGPMTTDPKLQKRLFSIDSLLLDFGRFNTHDAAAKFSETLKTRISAFGHDLNSLLTVFIGTTQLYGRPHLEQSFFEQQMSAVDDKLIVLDQERIELESEVELAAALPEPAIIAANINAVFASPLPILGLPVLK